MTGTTSNNNVGGGGVTVLTNGNYVVRSQFWNNGAIVDAGAITYGKGTGGTVGMITAANSVRGTTANGGSTQNFDFDTTNNQLVVGRPADNIVTLYRPPAVRLTPVADTWVQGADAFRNTNYGDSPEMQVKRTLNPGAGRGRRGFLRFNTSSVTGNVASARLRIFARLSDASLPPTVMIVQKVTDTTWNELTMTWNNQPRVASPNALAQITVSGATGQYYEFDLTSFIQAERAAGRTAVAFRLINQQATGNTGAFFTSVNSKEAATNRPQLVIEQ